MSEHGLRIGDVQIDPMTLVLGLAAIGLGTLIFVILKARGWKVSPGGLGRGLLGSLWLLPVVAVAVFLTRCTIPHLRDEAIEIPVEDQLVVRTIHQAEYESLLDIESSWHTTPEDALLEARRLAAARLDEAYRPEYALSGPWAVPDAVVEAAIASQSIEPKPFEFGGETEQTMHMARLKLDLTPRVRASYAAAWRARVAGVRLDALGGLAALAVLIVIAAAAYFRLDLSTAGQYRRRLKLATVSIIVAGGLLLAEIMPTRPLW